MRGLKVSPISPYPSRIHAHVDSLFIRIFLWFWAAMTVAGVVLLALEATRTERLAQRWRSVTSDAFAFYALSIAKDHEDEETWASREFLTDLASRTGIRAWLFDEQGRELSGHARAARKAHSRSMTEQMRRLIERAGRSGQTEFEPVGGITLAANVARAASGHRYALVGELPAPRYGPWQARPTIQALRLLAVLLTAGAVSWVLSRHLTTPIKRLHEATQRLAEGDLQARAGVGMGGRHDELAELGRAFDRMAERIESLLHEQERLVGAQRNLLRDVSHELRSPLARLGVALELARDRVEGMQPMEQSSGTPLAEVHNRIEREVGRLSEMIDRLLMLARLESGVQVPEATPVDLAALLHLVATDADFEARPQRRVVSVTTCDDCITCGTRDLLRSALENVVRNALRHTPEDTAVEVSLRQDDAWAVITVRDCGLGVPDAELSEIFRPFYRAGGGRDRGSGGAGLGLAITERAVQLHGGTVHARNAPGSGLIVEIRLPLASAGSEEANL